MIILIVLYIALAEWFQIGIEGEIKEIEIEDEVNMLQRLGTKIDGNIFSDGKPGISEIAGFTAYIGPLNVSK